MSAEYFRGGKGIDCRDLMENMDVTLGMIWNKGGGNLTQGESTDREIGIANAASWDVHVILESDNELSKPPVKDTFLEAPGEIDQKDKTIHKLFFKPDTFQIPFWRARDR
ncbi:hypothetical protein DXG01_003021 [Tephrocybe rancida]|nr:hypothetical protein DXG01_003021 [Tephrocybe rancida]